MTRKSIIIISACICLAASVTSGAAHEKPLPFLKKIGQFRDFSLSMTEAELKSAISRRAIYSIRSVEDARVNYHLTTESGENLIVMYDASGACRGIQRLRPTPKDHLKGQIGEVAGGGLPTKPHERARKLTRRGG